MVDMEMPLAFLGTQRPLRLGLMKAYTGHLVNVKESFNYGFSRHKMPVECVVGRLKGCWCCLLSR